MMKYCDKHNQKLVSSHRVKQEAVCLALVESERPIEETYRTRGNINTVPIGQHFIHRQLNHMVLHQV